MDFYTVKYHDKYKQIIFPIIPTVIPCFADSSSVWNSSYVFLTENIPRFVSWQVKLQGLFVLCDFSFTDNNKLFICVSFQGYGNERQISEELESFAKVHAPEALQVRMLISSLKSFFNGFFFAKHT